MNPILAAVSAACLRAPETFETAISAGARHMASERLARDMQGYKWLESFSCLGQGSAASLVCLDEPRFRGERDPEAVR